MWTNEQFQMRSISPRSWNRSQFIIYKIQRSFFQCRELQMVLLPSAHFENSVYLPDWLMHATTGKIFLHFSTDRKYDIHRFTLTISNRNPL